MRKEEGFVEVTLVREDQGGCGAHKMVLLSTSPKEMHNKRKEGREREGKIRRKEKVKRTCKGKCMDYRHLHLNTTHIHKWRPHPPSQLTTKVKVHHENLHEDLAYNEDWLSPDAQEELKGTGATWRQCQWCHGCPKTRGVELECGMGMEPVEEEVKAVSGGEGSQEWLHALWSRVEKEEQVEEEGGCEPAAGRRRRGGRASRLRRLLNFHLYLMERGLPMSRLLSQRGTETRHPRQRSRREQEVSASPCLRRGGEEVVRNGGGGGQWMEEEEEEEEGLAVESVHAPIPTFSICSPLWPTQHLSTPPSTPPSPSSPPPTEFPQQPGITPFPTPSLPFSPLLTPPFNPPFTLPLPHTLTYTPSYTPPYTLPYSPPYTPPYTPIQPPLPFSPCGPTPGPQWVVCGKCQNGWYTTPFICT